MSGKQAKRKRRAATAKSNSQGSLKLETKPEQLKKPQQKPSPKTPGMKLAKAKDLFEYGVLFDAAIVPNPLSDGWLVQVKGVSRDAETLETDRGGARVFKTLDAAFKIVEEIGFEGAAVIRKKTVLHG